MTPDGIRSSKPPVRPSEVSATRQCESESHFGHSGTKSGGTSQDTDTAFETSDIVEPLSVRNPAAYLEYRSELRKRVYVTISPPAGYDDDNFVADALDRLLRNRFVPRPHNVYRIV